MPSNDVSIANHPYLLIETVGVGQGLSLLNTLIQFHFLRYLKLHEHCIVSKYHKIQNFDHLLFLFLFITVVLLFSNKK